MNNPNKAFTLDGAMLKIWHWFNEQQDSTCRCVEMVFRVPPVTSVNYGITAKKKIVCADVKTAFRVALDVLKLQNMERKVETIEFEYLALALPDGSMPRYEVSLEY